MLIDGYEIDVERAENLDFSLVVEWVNGIDSLRTAMCDPETVEEDEE